MTENNIWILVLRNLQGFACCYKKNVKIFTYPAPACL